jgi:hypothetical protein
MLDPKRTVTAEMVLKTKNLELKRPDRMPAGI